MSATVRSALAATLVALAVASAASALPPPDARTARSYLSPTVAYAAGATTVLATVLIAFDDELRGWVRSDAVQLSDVARATAGAFRERGGTYPWPPPYWLPARAGPAGGAS